MSTMLYDRIFETTNTIGTGAYQLLGAESGFKSFASRFSDGQTLYYCCTDDVDWEIGIGTIDTVAGTLARTTVLASSQGDVAISWASGTRNLFCDLPASLLASLFDSAQAKGPLIRSDVNTYLAPSVLVVSTTQTALLTNWGSTYHFTNTSGVSLNLPAFAAIPDGYFVEVMCGGTASLTVDPNGTETVQGSTTFALTPGMWAKIIKQGTDWKVLSTQGGTLTKALNETSAIVASASTVDLGAVNANLVQITGTTTITSFGTAQAGTRRRVRFGTGLVLTHSGTLFLPGLANISTASGDCATFISLGSGTWVCFDYTRVDGKALVGPVVNKTLVVGAAAAMTPLTLNSRVQSTHGLGAAPDRVHVYLECLSAELGYAAGDRVFIEGSSFDLSGATIIITTSANATTLTVAISQNSPPALAPNSATPGTVTGVLTAANWKLVATPYRYA